MAREASEAPKERVNIVYKPAIGDEQAEKELPLKLIVLGDFTQRDDGRPVEDRKPIRIDKDTFNDVMREQDLRLSLTVPNKLSAEPDLVVNLTFKSERDFGPDSVVQQVPQLKKLLEIREALKFLRGPLGNKREFRQKIDQIVADPALKQRLLRELGIPEGQSTSEGT
jgi:type VI secretion system protein ImpB